MVSKIMRICSWVYGRIRFLTIRQNCLLYALTAVALMLLTYRNFEKSRIVKTSPKPPGDPSTVYRWVTYRCNEATIGKREIPESEYITITEGQETIDYLSEYLEIKVKIVLSIDHAADLVILMKNVGLSVIEWKKWEIYLNQVNLLPKEHVIDTNASFTLSHVTGTLYSIHIHEATFKPIKPMGERRLTIRLHNWLVPKFTIFPNWYVASETLTPRILESTKSDISRFVEEVHTNDIVEKYTPLARFMDNEKNTRDLGAAYSDVIPSAVEVNINEDDPYVSMFLAEWVIIASPDFESEAQYLSERLSLPIMQNPPTDKYIQLAKVRSRVKFSEEEYIVQFRKEDLVVRIISDTPHGSFNGIQSLLSIIDMTDINRYRLPSWIDIRDKPRFQHRGVHLDVARTFFPKETVFKFIDVISMYKLNVLHLHLTDDDGWRIQIPGLEELTQVGGHRCHDLEETHCLFPLFGSGPFNTSHGSGFYKVSDYQDILRYAAKRHVQIIPEIDIPGHSRAAVKSMQRRSTKKEKQKGEEYDLFEKGDKSVYTSPQNFEDGVINVCLESTYRFIKKVIFEIKIMHYEIQPLKTIHLGGDEIPVNAWKQSAACRKLIVTHTTFDMRLNFLHRLTKILEDENLDMGLWEDGVIPPGEMVNPYNRSQFTSRSQYSGKILTNTWDNKIEDGKFSRAYTFANNGYNVIMSLGSHLYLDHRYDPDDEDVGVHWAASHIDTRKIFRFFPTNLYANVPDDVPANKTLCYDKNGCQLLRKENIIGMEALIWTELMHNTEKLFYMVFPRILAVAERAWSKGKWEDVHDVKTREESQLNDWIRFSNFLGYRELKRLDRFGIPYRVPPPGARLKNRFLEVNVEFPGLDIEYSIDHGTTWTVVKRLVSPEGTQIKGAKIYSAEDVLVRTLSADKSRHSKIVTVKNIPY